MALLGSLLKAFEAVEAAEKSIKDAEETLAAAKSKFSVLTNDIAYGKAEFDKKTTLPETWRKTLRIRKFTPTCSRMSRPSNRIS